MHRRDRRDNQQHEDSNMYSEREEATQVEEEELGVCVSLSTEQQLFGNFNIVVLALYCKMR
jgi:hypothetical protein